jgi:divalent metal cation (Fe/Co/Zn/Cd) transporter
MSSLPQYEFDSKQHDVIERLSRSMKWIASPLSMVGILCALGGILSLVQAFRQPSSVPSAVYALFGAVLFLALGNWTRNAARSFHRIVTTTGQDIDHLMDGLNNLRKMYALLSVIVKIYVVVLLLALVAAVATMAVAFWN